MLAKHHWLCARSNHLAEGCLKEESNPCQSALITEEGLMLWNGEQACVQGLLLAIHGRDSGRNLHVYQSSQGNPIDLLRVLIFVFL